MLWHSRVWIYRLLVHVLVMHKHLFWIGAIDFSAGVSAMMHEESVLI